MKVIYNNTIYIKHRHRSIYYLLLTTQICKIRSLKIKLSTKTAKVKTKLPRITAAAMMKEMMRFVAADEAGRKLTHYTVWDGLTKLKPSWSTGMSKIFV